MTNEAALLFVAGILGKAREDYQLLLDYHCLADGFPVKNPPGLTTEESWSAALFFLTIEEHVPLYQFIDVELSAIEILERCNVHRFI